QMRLNHELLFFENVHHDGRFFVDVNLFDRRGVDSVDSGVGVADLKPARGPDQGRNKSWHGGPHGSDVNQSGAGDDLRYIRLRSHSFSSPFSPRGDDETVFVCRLSSEFGWEDCFIYAQRASNRLLRTT